MKVERIYSEELTVEKILKVLFDTQIDNLIKIQSNNDDLSQTSQGSEKI